MRLMMLVAAMVAATTAAACGGGSTTPTNCTSGKAWTGGNSESPLMNPGQDCIACHASESEAPKFVIAGTVMGATNDDDNCDGLEAVKVRITGNDGAVLELTTNAAGNFFAREGMATVALPFTAEVEGPGGKINKMTTPQSDGSCNSCHGATGTNGAPGRIIVPE